MDLLPLLTAGSQTRAGSLRLRPRGTTTSTIPMSPTLTKAITAFNTTTQALAQLLLDTNTLRRQQRKLGITLSEDPAEHQNQVQQPKPKKPPKKIIPAYYFDKVTLTCGLCPTSAHVHCYVAACDNIRQRFVCFHHHCKVCNRSASEADGLLYRCIYCAYSWCHACVEEGFTPIEHFNSLQKFGYETPRIFEYVCCAQCNSRTEADWHPAEGEEDSDESNSECFRRIWEESDSEEDDCVSLDLVLRKRKEEEEAKLKLKEVEQAPAPKPKQTKPKRVESAVGESSFISADALKDLGLSSSDDAVNDQDNSNSSPSKRKQTSSKQATNINEKLHSTKTQNSENSSTIETPSTKSSVMRIQTPKDNVVTDDVSPSSQQTNSKTKPKPKSKPKSRLTMKSLVLMSMADDYDEQNTTSSSSSPSTRQKRKGKKKTIDMSESSESSDSANIGLLRRKQPHRNNKDSTSEFHGKDSSSPDVYSYQDDDNFTVSNDSYYEEKAARKLKKVRRHIQPSSMSRVTTRTRWANDHSQHTSTKPPMPTRNLRRHTSYRHNSFQVQSLDDLDALESGSNNSITNSDSDSQVLSEDNESSYSSWDTERKSHSSRNHFDKDHNYARIAPRTRYSGF